MTTTRMSAAKYARGLTFACAFAGAATFVISCDDDKGQGAIAPGDPAVVDTGGTTGGGTATGTAGTGAAGSAAGTTGSGTGTLGGADGNDAINGGDGDLAAADGDAAAAAGDVDTSPASSLVKWTGEGLRFEYSGPRLPCDGSLILKGKKLDKKTAEVRVVDVNQGREKVACLERTTLSIVIEDAPRTVENVKFYPEVGEMQTIAVAKAEPGTEGAATEAKAKAKKH